MRISIHSSTTNRGTVADVVSEVARVRDHGLGGYWAPMLNGLDTLTALAVATREVPDVPVATAVVPIPLRSPYALAQQALTLQMVSGGRLTVGLGTSHRPLAEGIFGVEWAAPLATMRAYLGELQGLLAGSHPERLQPVAPAPQIVLGAVNPRMTELAAETADGVVTWAAGLRTVDEVIRPVLTGRTTPFRVVVCQPLCVTSDEPAAREAVHRKLGANDALPSYRSVLERERAAGIAALSLVGDEAQVAEQLDRFADAGVTEFGAHVVASGPDDERTWQFLADYAKR